MTVSVLALVTDVVRQGKPVVGFGFSSNGRYAPSELLRERFIPRLKAAGPETPVDESGENLDPVRVWDVVRRNEKPRSEEHTSELQSLTNLVCRLLLEK